MSSDLVGAEEIRKENSSSCHCTMDATGRVLGSHLPGFRGLLGNPIPWTNSWQQQGTPCSLPCPWLVEWPIMKFPSVEEDAERHMTVSELIFTPQDSSLGISFPVRQPGDLGHLQLWFQLPKQTPCQLHRNFRFNLGELESPSCEGGERTGRRRGAGRLRETAVALCPSPENV